MKNYRLAHFDAIDPVRCPCGFSRRAFATPDNRSPPCTSWTSRRRAHALPQEDDRDLSRARRRRALELDGELVPVQPMTTVMIQPGCRHRPSAN